MEQDNNLSLYRVLGELSADMKHVIKTLDTNRDETRSLREEMRQENADLKTRLTKVETFNLKVLTYASLAIPALIFLFNFAVQWLFPFL